MKIRYINTIEYEFSESFAKSIESLPRDEILDGVEYTFFEVCVSGDSMREPIIKGKRCQ